MSQYNVLRGIQHNGTHYQEGQVIELSDKEAAQLQHGQISIANGQTDESKAAVIAREHATELRADADAAVAAAKDAEDAAHTAEVKAAEAEANALQDAVAEPLSVKEATAQAARDEDEAEDAEKVVDHTDTNDPTYSAKVAAAKSARIKADKSSKAADDAIAAAKAKAPVKDPNFTKVRDAERARQIKQQQGNSGKNK